MVTHWRRLLRHLMLPPWRLRQALPAASLQAIEAAIAGSERHHRGQIRFAVDAVLDPWQLLRGLDARERALQVFGQLRVWDTDENNGVLIYMLLADHRVEIIADRGIATRVVSIRWEEICTAMGQAFRRGDFEYGALEAVAAVGALLEAHYPGSADNTLADAPVVL